MQFVGDIMRGVGGAPARNIVIGVAFGCPFPIPELTASLIESYLLSLLVPYLRVRSIWRLAADTSITR